MRLDRRLGGMLVLTVVVLAVLIVPRLLNSGIAGSATREPDPPPPAVGSCVLWPTYSLIDCAEPHSAEVLQTWAADDTDRPNLSTGCNSDLATYLGLRPPGIAAQWHLPSSDLLGPEGLPMAGEVMFAAPVRERIGGPGWLACAAYVVNPPETVTGRLADLMVPVGSGRCFAQLGTANNIQPEIGCAQKHRMEMIGTLAMITGTNNEMRWGSISVPQFPAMASVQNECLLMAQNVLATPDPTFDGRVQVRIDYQVDQADFSGDDDGASMLVVSCYLLTSPPLLLTDSLVGIGDNPLPTG